jgi:hypothetical protein
MVGIVISVAALVISLLPMIASSDLDKVREVRLTVREMTYYVDGSTEPNPTLVFRAGEKVRVILKNEDAGMDHDFTVPTWDVKSKLLEGRGETKFVIKVPKKRGDQTYLCTPHSKMMRGTIHVE